MKFNSLSFGKSTKPNNNPIEDEELFISGGISGATITNPLSDRALRYANTQYQAIRKFSTDVQKIVENLNGMYSYEEIQKIKNYLFIDEHLLGEKVKRFDPCFEIARSWFRLAFDFKNVQKHDITLIKHELYEMDLVNEGWNQDDAHNVASVHYNYKQESEEFYDNLAKKKG